MSESEYEDEEYEESLIEESEAKPAEAPKPAEEPEPEAPEQEEPEQEEPEQEESETPNEPAEPPKRGSIAQSESEAPKLRRVERPAHKDADQEGQNLTEAEIAMLEAKKRHEAEQEAKMADNEERRRAELQKVEQELEVLKQRQIERKKEREIEEQQFVERRKQDDERRRREEEDRKSRIEAQKRIKEEEKLKRQQMMAGSFVTTTVGNKRKQRTAEQQAEAKRNYLASIQKADVSNLLPNDLKAKIKSLYQRICRLESEKYDLTKRHERQDYDLKELSERESQGARKKALALGVEVEEAQAGKVRPPKVRVASQFDRQKDSRTYVDKRDKFENPFVKPDPSIAHGSGRPPPEWGRRHNDEIETIRKVMDSPKYVELAPVEGAKPPVDVIPMQIPSADE